MTVSALIDRLEGVKRTGPDRWLARCPAHDDRSASLSIRELDDGRVLAHCFAGCAVAEIVAAVDLRLDDLFPPRDERLHARRGERRPFPAADVLRAVDREALIVAVAASTLGNGGVLTADDRARLIVAASRIAAALEASRHVR